jgi:pyruvate/2-oxoglutarate/acetoin dehydrogenase E1 component
MPAIVVENRESEGVSVQVIDLQSLVRLGREAIVVACGGRRIVVEDHRWFGFLR